MATGGAVNTESDVNILLLGESGVGKSTFINAFANYLTYDEMPVDTSQRLVSLIAASFTMYDENYQEKLIEFGQESKHEQFRVGDAATRDTSCYEFPLGDRIVRIIDTPGIGDPRGIRQDNLNFDNILSFLNEFENLHCICILLKPNNARLSVTFDFCIKQLLCHLQKDASKNIVFVYTNARSTFYKPGDTGPLLTRMLKSIEASPPHVKIAHDLDRVYCMDNEAFRFILAIHNGVKFDDDTKKDFKASWNKSAKECQRLMKYIIGFPGEQWPLVPHKIKDTISVNTARKMILDLARPLADIIDNVSVNITVLNKHKKAIEEYSSNITQLQGQLYIPVIRMKVVRFTKPQTACTNVQCCEVQSIEGVQRYVNKTICHDPCTVKNVTGDIIGHPELQECEAMDPETGSCQKCGCSYLVHMHKYYGVEEVADRVIDNVVESRINAEANANQKAQTILEESQNRINKYESEKQCITNAMAKFAHFLKENAIICYNDAFKRYLEYKIENLKASTGENNDQLIKDMEQMMNEYERKIEELQKAMKKADGAAVGEEDMTADGIMKIIEDLKNLEISGGKICEMQQAQEGLMKEEFKHRIVVVQGIHASGMFNFMSRAFRKGKKMLTGMVPIDVKLDYLTNY